MLYQRFQLQQVFFILIVLAGYFNIFPRECADTYIIPPPGYDPDMGDVILFPLPYLRPEISYGGCQLPDTGADHIIPVHVRIGGTGPSMSCSDGHCYLL